MAQKFLVFQPPIRLVTLSELLETSNPADGTLSSPADDTGSVPTALSAAAILGSPKLRGQLLTLVGITGLLALAAGSSLSHWRHSLMAQPTFGAGTQAMHGWPQNFAASPQD